MGSAISAEMLAGYADKVRLVSAVDAEDSPLSGKTVHGTDVLVLTPSGLEEALKNADCCINFSLPEAEVESVPEIVSAGKNVVLATTGFTEEQFKKIEDAVESSEASMLYAPNFSPLVNVQLHLAKIAVEKLALLGYDFGVVEEHHTRKKDAPSGTAKKLLGNVSSSGGGERIVFRNEGSGPWKKGDLDAAVFRLGGTPGQHELRIVGKHGRMVLETLMYSRADFAKGAIEGALWLRENGEPGKIYGMEDVLKL